MYNSKCCSLRTAPSGGCVQGRADERLLSSLAAGTHRRLPSPARGTLGRAECPERRPEDVRALLTSRSRRGSAMGMRPAAVAAAAMLLLLAVVSPTAALYQHINEGEEKCFIEDVPESTLVLGACVSGRRCARIRGAALADARTGSGTQCRSAWKDTTTRQRRMSYRRQTCASSWWCVNRARAADVCAWMLTPTMASRIRPSKLWWTRRSSPRGG
jgi:hypothetical protein